MMVMMMMMMLTNQSLDAQQQKLYAHCDGRVGTVDAAGVHVELPAEQMPQQALLRPTGLSTNNISSIIIIISSSSSSRVFNVIRPNHVISIAPRTCTGTPIDKRYRGKPTLAL